MSAAFPDCLTARWPAGLFFERNLLHAPVLRFAGIQLGLARAVDLVHPVELADLLAERSEPADHLAFEIGLVDLAAGIGAVDELLALRVRRRNAHAPRRAHVADDADRVQIRIEHLDARVAAIADVNVAL